MQAIDSVTARPELHTKDLGGNARTEEVTNAVCALLAQNVHRQQRPQHAA
jgi:tartrate dehydrogenase/decarboxylase / D-malate dehydrogenase